MCFLEKSTKESPTENRYPLRSKSRVSTRIEENRDNFNAQEIEPSPNKRPKLDLPTLGM